MEDKELRKWLRSKLLPFILEFERNNIGNRFSPELIQGLGARLEDYMFAEIKALLETNEKKKQKEQVLKEKNSPKNTPNS